MSAFEVSVTPSRIKPKKRIESREPAIVVMAPFSAKAIVQFEDVPITKTARRFVRIINPSNEDIEVKVMKPIKEEHNLSVEWMEQTVPANEEVSMELIWSPLIDVACKETLQLIDNRNFRKDVMIILKSRSLQPVRTARKFPTVGKTLQLKSPTSSLSKAQKSVILAPQQKKRLSISAAIGSGSTANATKSSWRNGPAVRAGKAPLCDQNVYRASTVESVTVDAPLSKTHVLPQPLSFKENVSPLTQANVFSLIDNMQFTPLREVSRKSESGTPQPDNLAVWPTPNEMQQNKIVITTGFRPRRLNSALEDDHTEYCLNMTCDRDQVGSDITFDVKKSDSLNVCTDTLDCSQLRPCNTLNRTTTIAQVTHTRALSCIQEEDGSLPTLAPQTPHKLKVLDLKREINAVGSPLRKYSESMKNLLLTSPKSKIAIQGSMPNLNEMLQLQSIEQNRYYQPQQQQLMSSPKDSKQPSLDNSFSSNISTVSQTDVLFNHCEILAQSSRCNLHELGMKTQRDNRKTVMENWTKDQNKENFKQIKGTIVGHSIVGHKRRSLELSLSDADAQSNDSLYRNETMTISPPKRQRFDGSTLVSPVNASARSSATKVWTHAQTKKLKLAQTMSLLKKPSTSRKIREQQRNVKLYDSDLFLHTYINPDPFAASTTADPFLASTMYLDEQAVERHQADFKKWLNALVSIPADLDADNNNKIDVGKLFNEVRNKDLSLAPTKEVQSLNYLTNSRLETLRRAAVDLYFGEQMRVPCSKVAVYVQKQALRIRSDRNLHLDVVMQRSILELLLCFNPLWLRLGLEVVFGEKLHLQSNRDIVGLSTFILNRLFRNKLEEQRFSKAYTLTEEYAESIKKHSLQKILFLLLFLDQAKQRRIIKHNPCLFVKKSPYKETRDILLRFSSELLANIGDITRELRRMGYVLQHKQTFLDEFNYAFSNLAIDLRDGVRLTRVMEIILLRDDLTQQLRVPAISRLQRIYNVKLALTALQNADFQLTGNISAADIVDGYREKTLSLLWQLCYKFRSPKFNAAACILQRWWRRRWLFCFLRRRIRERAAIQIQAAFRGYQMRKFVRLYRVERLEATIVLQKYSRRYLAQKRLYEIYRSIIRIQQWWRAQRLGNACRQQFIRLSESTTFLQRIWRRHMFSKRLLAAAAEARLKRDQIHQAAASCIQVHWRAHRTAKKLRQSYLRQRQLIIFVQQRVHGKQLTQRASEEFQQLRNAALTIQQRFRANQQMLRARQTFLEVRSAAITFQIRWRAIMVMRMERKNYCQLKLASILLQTRFRAQKQLRENRFKYLQLRHATVVLQQRYRARLEMLRVRHNYELNRQCLIKFQKRWRATKEMQHQRRYYQQLALSTKLMQAKYRARIRMRKQRDQFIQLKSATLTIQRRWRACQLMRTHRHEYQRLVAAAVVLQRRFHAYRSMRYFSAKYRGILTAVACLQMHWRGYLLTKRIRCSYQQLIQSTIIIQRNFRCTLVMRRERSCYQLLRRVTIQMQIRFRATLEMRRQLASYELQRRYIIRLQQRYRAMLDMRLVRDHFNRQRQAARRIQLWWLSQQQMRVQRQHYQGIRTSCVKLQRKWRATLQARDRRQVFLRTLNAVRLVQCRIRSTRLMMQQRSQYLLVRQYAIVLQRQYRARQVMRQERLQYLQLRTVVIMIQRMYRSKRIVKRVRDQFQLLRRITVHLQQKFRGKRLMLVEQSRFMMLVQSTIVFQARVRGYLARRSLQALMTPEIMMLMRQKLAAKVIQRYWRGYQTRKRHRHVELQTIRQRLGQLRKQTISVNSVRSKVEESVRILRGRFIASDALTVLTQLDRLSRTVPHLLMWCSEFMSTFCYGIMAQAIRSEIDKQLIERCSRIILNLARYNSSTVNTFQEGGLVTVAQMLLRWCDKDCDIFNTLCTLIWVFAHCPRKREIIHNYMTNTEAIYMVRETRKLVARKEKMKQNTRKPIVPVSRTGHQQTFNYSPTDLPSLESDFGIIRNSPYVFISSVFAFDSILGKLNIDII